MTDKFDYIVFSIFDICDFNKFTDAVSNTFENEISSGKADITSTIPVISEYANPKSGGAHCPNFVVGKIIRTPTKCFLFRIMKMDWLMYAEPYKNI